MKTRYLMVAIVSAMVALSFSASPASAQSINFQATKEVRCEVGLTSDIVSCKASCPKGRWAVSGHCRAKDTRGRAFAVSSFGTSTDGQDWQCDFMDTRNIGINKSQNESGMEFYVYAICLNR